MYLDEFLNFIILYWSLALYVLGHPIVHARVYRVVSLQWLTLAPSSVELNARPAGQHSGTQTISLLIRLKLGGSGSI